MSESIPLDPDRDTGEGDTRASGGAEPANDEPTYDDIARCAYEIFESGAGGTAQEHWERAERELRRRAAAG
jgi:hypothetical protein